MRIKITDSDLKYAIQRDQCACAINLAIARQLPEAKFIQVNTKTIRYTIGDQRFVFQTPKVADEKIIRPFDTTHTIERRSFELNEERDLLEVRPAGNTPAKQKTNARLSMRKRAQKLKSTGRPFGSHNRYTEAAEQ